MHAATLAIESASLGVRDVWRRPRWPFATASLVGYVLLVLAAWSASPPDLPDVRSPRPEQEIKAAFLYKFLNYVDWPAGAFASGSSPIVVGVLGADGVADELRAIVARRSIGQHPVDVRVVGEPNALDGVNVAFVGASAASALSRLVPAARERSVLLVTDFPNALAHGSVINLVVVDARVRFEVSLEAAERSGLKLSSRLLSVALRVRPVR